MEETLQEWTDSIPYCVPCMTRHDPEMKCELIGFVRGLCWLCLGLHALAMSCPPARLNYVPNEPMFGIQERN